MSCRKISRHYSFQLHPFNRLERTRKHEKVSEAEIQTDRDANRPRQLRLDQLLQLVGVAQTGGEAKILIQAGEVAVNGEIDTRRKRKLHSGDRVQFDGQSFSVDEFV